MTTPEQPKTYPLTPEGVAEAIEALGHSPEDIAATLAKLEIKGQRHSEDHDAVSNYLRKVLPPFEAIYVWAHDIRIEGSRIEHGFHEPFVIAVFSASRRWAPSSSSATPTCTRISSRRQAMPEVRVGQLWQDNDPRIVEVGKGARYVRVTHVGVTHATVESWYASDPDNTRTGRVRLNRFAPSSTGYRLVEEAPNAAA